MTQLSPVIANRAAAQETEAVVESKSVQLPVAVPEDIAAAIDKFHQLLSDYKALGFSFRPTDMIAYPASEDTYNLEGHLINSELSISTGASPDEIFKYRYGAERDLPEGYRSEKPLDLATCRLHLSEIAPDKLAVTAYDCLNKSDPIVGRWQLQLDGDKFVDQEQVSELATELSKALQKRNSSHPDIIATEIKPSAATAAAFSLAEPLDEVSATKLKELLGTYDVTADAVKTNAAVDEVFALSNSQIASRPTQIELTVDSLEKTGNAAIRIDGQLEQIYLNRAESVAVTDYDKEAQTVNGAPEVSRATDKWGNIIRRGLVVSGDEKSVKDVVVVYPPTRFAKAGEQVAEESAVNIDLSVIGADFEGVEVKGLFKQKVETLLEQSAGYSFYSNIDHEKTREVLAPHRDAVTQGIVEAEKMFGIAPGDLVDNAYIVGGNTPNAHFKPNNPNTVVFRDSIFETAAKNVNGQISLVARHETFHAIDHMTKDGLSSGSFEKTFLELKSRDAKFLHEVNESSFSDSSAKHDDIELGGHAAANPKELFATFCNSLTHPNWHERINEQSVEFREDYKTVLKALQENLKTTAEVPASAPIHELLQQRLTSLDANTAK